VRGALFYPQGSPVYRRENLNEAIFAYIVHLSKVTRETMELPNLLYNACALSVEAEVRPISDMVACLRERLTSFEVAHREDAEQRTIAAMLAAIKQEASTPAPSIIDAERLKLCDALTSLLELIGAVPFQAPPQELKASPVPVKVVEVPPVKVVLPPQAPPHEDPAVEEDPLAHSAQRILDEIEDFATSDLRKKPPAQIQTYVQALTAEVRQMLTRLPSTHHLFWQVERSIPLLSKVRGDNCPHNYVRGLAKDHNDDWDRIARESREKLAAFEGEEDVILAKTVTPGEWPTLRARLQNKPLVIIGGIVKDEKLRTIRERFNIEAEWYPTDNGGHKISSNLAHKIRNGGVGAMIILEGLIGHAVSKKLTDAAGDNPTPYALAYRGGVGDLRASFDSLERASVDLKLV